MYLLYYQGGKQQNEVYIGVEPFEQAMGHHMLNVWVIH